MVKRWLLLYTNANTQAITIKPWFLPIKPWFLPINHGFYGLYPWFFWSKNPVEAPHGAEAPSARNPAISRAAFGAGKSFTISGRWPVWCGFMMGLIQMGIWWVYMMGIWWWWVYDGFNPLYLVIDWFIMVKVNNGYTVILVIDGYRVEMVVIDWFIMVECFIVQR